MYVMYYTFAAFAFVSVCVVNVLATAERRPLKTSRSARFQARHSGATSIGKLVKIIWRKTTRSMRTNSNYRFAIGKNICLNLKAFLARA